MAAIKITITPSAYADTDRIGTFLDENWSPEIAIRFFNAFYRILDMLETSPEVGMPSLKVAGIRRKMIDRYNALYYDFRDGEVVVLRLYDTRSNPADNPY